MKSHAERASSQGWFRRPTKCVAVAIFAFEAHEDDELDLSEGDRVDVLYQDLGE